MLQRVGGACADNEIEQARETMNLIKRHRQCILWTPVEGSIAELLAARASDTLDF